MKDIFMGLLALISIPAFAGIVEGEFITKTASKAIVTHRGQFYVPDEKLVGILILETQATFKGLDLFDCSLQFNLKNFDWSRPVGKSGSHSFEMAYADQDNGYDIYNLSNHITQTNIMSMKIKVENNNGSFGHLVSEESCLGMNGSITPKLSFWCVEVPDSLKRVGSTNFTTRALNCEFGTQIENYSKQSAGKMKLRIMERK